MSKIFTRLPAVLLASMLFALLSGCNRPEPLMKDQANYVFTVSDPAAGWKIESDSAIEINVNSEDQIIEIGGKATRISNSDHLPNIRVSGKSAKFKVFNCGTLVTSAGTIVEAYSCQTVKARAGSTVSVFISSKLLAIYKDTKILKTKSVGNVYCFRNPLAVDEEADSVDCYSGEPLFPDKFKDPQMLEQSKQPEKPTETDLTETDLKDSKKIPDGNYRME